LTPARRLPAPARRFALRAVAAGTLATGMLMMTATAGWAAPPQAPALREAAAAASDSFYTPPSPLPAGQPGDLIRYRSAPSPDPGTTAWQVLYLSTTVSGSPAAVSGTVIVPDSPYAGPRPVVAYGSGTQGWGDQCAPSVEMASGTYDEQFAVSNLLAKGWAVAVTDYPGLGTPGDETYAVGIAEGYAVLDVMRAATHLPGAGLSGRAPMAIEGYSQGGGAAGWAAQLQPSYAPAMHLVGVAAGGTPANLQAVAANINGSAFFAFLGGAAIGFNAAYPSRHLLSGLTPSGQAALARLDTMCQDTALPLYAGQRIENYTAGHINPISEPRWQTVLTANDLGGMKPAVPLLQYHGLADEVIPYQVEAALHRQYCAQGVTTQLTAFPGDHVLTQVEAQPAVVNWISARLAGTPAPANC
ncbi:MAG: triacylglycerol lipase, partial [Actinobacteria bacterium]|nr:triacylglycerol lipase [Actinomycetota bacterium]